MTKITLCTDQYYNKTSLNSTARYEKGDNSIWFLKRNVRELSYTKEWIIITITLNRLTVICFNLANYYLVFQP